MAIGVITGSGTYALPGFDEAGARDVATRWGSARLTTGTVAWVEVVHVSRHLAGHARLSNQVEHRANLDALRQAGVSGVVAVTVCGAVDPTVPLGSLIAFDDLHFLANRLADGSLCTFHDTPGAAGRSSSPIRSPTSLPCPLGSPATSSGCRPSAAPRRRAPPCCSCCGRSPPSPCWPPRRPRLPAR